MPEGLEEDTLSPQLFSRDTHNNYFITHNTIYLTPCVKLAGRALCSEIQRWPQKITGGSIESRVARFVSRYHVTSQSTIGTSPVVVGNCEQPWTC